MTESTESQLAHHRYLLKRLEALAFEVPTGAFMLQSLIEHHQQQIAALEAVEAIAAAPTGEMTLGYQKSATGAMQPRPVRVYGPVGNEHRTRTNVLHITTGQQSESRAFWPDTAEVFPGGPDIRIDPPYDR